MSETFTRKQLQAAVAKRLEDFEFAGQVLLDKQREHITALEKENAELKADCQRKDELLTAAVDDYTDAIADNAELRKALEMIRDYPPAGGRRTADGYPMEVVYDEFAYRRIVDAYRLAARLASTERTEG